MRGLMLTPYFKYSCSLSKSSLRQSFIAKVHVIDWILPQRTLPPVSNTYHSSCLHPLVVSEDKIDEPASPLKCNFCAVEVPNEQITPVFTIRWILEDNQENKLTVEASPKVNNELISLTPFEFQACSFEE